MFHIPYQNQLKNNLGKDNPALHNGVAWGIYQNILLGLSQNKEQDIIDKAKEINKKIKEKQANSQSNISSEIGNEEPLPLNDPFVGDSSLTGGSTLMMSDPEEAKNEMSLYKFKKVG